MKYVVKAALPSGEVLHFKTDHEEDARVIHQALRTAGLEVTVARVGYEEVSW